MKQLVFAATIAGGASMVLAHGVQIQITHNAATGQIETREIVLTGSRPNQITPPKRVYVMPLLATLGGAGDGWYTRPNDERNALNIPLYPSGPGLCFQYDEAGQLPGTGWAFSGSSTLPNLQNTNFGYSLLDGLKKWDGAAWVDPGIEQLQMMRGDGTSPPTVTANTSDAGPFATLALASIASKSTNPHSSVSYRLLGDGVSSSVGGTADGDDGIYLLSLRLISTAQGVGASEPFYFVMHKNQSETAAIAAANSLGFDSSLVQVVPEPVGVAVVSMAGALTLQRRRKA